MSKPSINKEVIQAVNAYLLARAYAETQRDRVDEIQRRVLAENIYYEDKELTGESESKRITEPRLAFLMSDADGIEYCSTVRRELVKAGYVIDDDDPKGFHHYKCPALTAEGLQRDAEAVVIEASAAILDCGEDFLDQLMMAGMDKYKQFLDLSVKMVVNMPGYEKPAIPSK